MELCFWVSWLETENEYFNLNHSQVQVLIWTPRYKRTNFGWLLVLGFLVCKQSLGFVSVVPSTQVLGEEFPCCSCGLNVWHWKPPPFLLFHCYFKSLGQLWLSSLMLTVLLDSEVEIPKGGFIKIKQIYNLRICKAWLRNQLCRQNLMDFGGGGYTWLCVSRILKIKASTFPQEL